MKALKGKTLMSLIYAMCLSIPLVSILSRVIYVQSNKNAYQSYYGETINEENKTYYNVSQLETNKSYYQQTPLITTLNDQVSESFMSVANLVINGNSIPEANRLRLYYTQNFATLFAYYNSTSIGGGYNLTNNTNNLSFTFEGILSGENYWSSLFDGSYYTIEYNKYSYLDNVFDYSINQLVNENNFGQLNFFSWFDNMLLTDAQQNMLYVRFVNWYLNYALLVSLMQILFLCLMWFVNFSRKLLDRGMNYDW